VPDSGLAQEIEGNSRMSTLNPEIGATATADVREQFKISDYVAEALYHKGVRQVFQLSGGMIMQLLDSLDHDGRIQLVTVHHEQSAAFAADAQGRITGVPGVAIATSGPGATNLITGIGSCYFDSSPAVFITGQVNRHEQKQDRNIRQLGFQETDIVSMVRPITKDAWQIRTPEEIPAALDRAFVIATEGRPGPVLIDIPADISWRVMEHQPQQEPTETRATSYVDCEPLCRALLNSRRPLILAGGGVRAGRSADAFRSLVDRLGVPVVTSLLGLDLLPYSHPSRVGMIGTYGNRWANLALGSCDLLLVLGSRLDVRQTGACTEALAEGRRIFHVDCEAGELNNRVKGCETTLCDLAFFIPQLIAATEGFDVRHRWADWVGEIDELRSRWPDTNELAGFKGINPNILMHRLSHFAKKASAYVADVGLHQMWAAQSLELTQDQRFLTSGGMGSMGFALPAALGAALSVPGAPVAVIAGDAGFQCNIQELQTVARLMLPLKIVILNNRCHGMTRQFQDTYFEGRHVATVGGYSAPDFARVAEAYGIPGRTMGNAAEMDEMLNWLLEDPETPQLLHVEIDKHTNAYPKIAFGKPVTEMEPFSKPISIEGT
jgi:acetolactate synthase-1/2/3 large subunit